MLPRAFPSGGEGPRIRLAAMNPSPWHIALAAASLALSFAEPARADEPPAPSSPAPPAVIPPRPLTPLTVESPEGAEGAHTVVLELTVNADGTVRDARALLGDEPFASKAVETARGWRFSPATRSDPKNNNPNDLKPVAARIRVRVDFKAKENPPQLPPDPPVMPSPVRPSGKERPRPPIKPAKPAEPEGILVDVHGERPAPAASSLSRAEVRVLPGAFGDPFRAIESLPGVTPIFCSTQIRSMISGSMAALRSSVTPSARTAVSSTCSVAPTLG